MPWHELMKHEDLHFEVIYMLFSLRTQQTSIMVLNYYHLYIVRQGSRCLESLPGSLNSIRFDIIWPDCDQITFYVIYTRYDVKRAW